MKKTILFATISSSIAAVALYACGGDDTKVNPTDAGSDHTTVDGGADTGSGGDTGGGNDSGNDNDASDGATGPTPPTLGTLIDRMGRPAINTALNHTFDTTAAKGPAKDAYNADNSPANWKSYVPQFKANLAIYDGLDTTCGNQAAYGALTNPDYTTLASVLAGDALVVNTANSTCVQYLGVEFAVLGIANTDCGGRTPNENVIDLTFNAVAGTLTPGTLPGNPGPVTNGITAPASPATTTFPYLAAPH
ncbi:MAG TPA: DUF4331 family protein [Polyangiaceae bacterium]